jgi:acyl carrier protein
LDTETLEEGIRAFLRDQLALEQEIGRDSLLVTTGLIDSPGLVHLATHLERMLGIAIPDRDITADHFDSISAILDYLRSRS